EDCARFLGIPVLTDYAALAEAITKWRVRWVPRGAPGVYADAADFDFPGCQTSHLTTASDHHGTDPLVVTIRPERASDHAGGLVADRALVRAELAVDRPPDLGTFTSVGGGALAAGPVGAFLGIGSGLVDVLIGWYQSISTIDAEMILH